MSDEIPDDHPIHQLMHDDARLDLVRLGVWEGVIEMARDGDKQAFKILIDRYTNSVERGHPPPKEIRDWIIKAFQRIRKGESADIVFGIKPGPGGRKKTRDSGVRRKRAMVALYIINHYEPKNKKRTLEIVKREAAIKFEVGESDAQKIYDEWRSK